MERVLQELLNGPKSGEEIASHLGISRAAVNKCVKKLQDEGFKVVAVPGKGYTLTGGNVLNKTVILHYLKTPWTVNTAQSTTSTNNEAKAHGARGEDFFAFVADMQTAGKGRIGRTFFSPPGTGLYMSALVRICGDCTRLTAYAAIATVRAIERLGGDRVDIKWVNDLYMRGKKICGILTEGSLDMESGVPEYAVIGIGVNVRHIDFPAPLCARATTIEDACGTVIDRNRLCAEILNELYSVKAEISSGAFMDEYRARNIVPGTDVIVNGAYTAHAVGIDDNCGLILNKDGKTFTVQAGEVSLHTEAHV